MAKNLKRLYADLYQRLEVEMLEEAKEEFKAFHLRNPTLVDESNIYERISPLIETRFKEIIASYDEDVEDFDNTEVSQEYSYLVGDKILT